MNKSHVVSLPLSRQLKALGCPQESGFYWQLFNNGADLVYSDGYEGNSLNQLKATSVSAYLASELMEYVPGNLFIKNDIFSLLISNCEDDFPNEPNNWLISYEDADSEIGELHRVEGDELTETLAKMLIYLLEQCLVTFPKGGK